MELLNEQEEKLINSLMTAYIAQMDSALKISKIISEHSDEDELSVDAIISGLVYRLMVPMDDTEIKESMDFAKKLIHGESSDEEGDEDEEGEEGDEYEEGEADGEGEESPQAKIIFNRKVRVNTCNCDICCRTRTCLINYETFDVTDPLAEKFRDAIQKTCDTHKITI